MYAAFDSPHAHKPDTAQRMRKKGSPNFLSSVKGLIKRPARKHLEASRLNSHAPTSRSTSESAHRLRQCSRSPVPQSQVRSWVQSLRERPSHRKHLPSMIDYLTLAQLENVWYSQDSCRGFLTTNQTTAAPEIQLQEQRQSSRGTDENSLTQSTRRRPTSLAQRLSSDGSAWSRPPSYQP